MPTNNAWNIGWGNQNSQRNYPISEDVSRLDDTGNFTLPNNFLVDLSWTYTNDLDASKFHILSISRGVSSLVVVIGYDNVKAGTATIDIDSFQLNNVYLLEGTGDHYDSVGTIVIGYLDDILDQLGDIVTFDVENTKLEATTVRQLIRGVSTISVEGEDFSITGDVTINTGTNIRIDSYVDSGVTYLVFNAVSTSDMIADCVECGDEPKQTKVITSINGIRPDVNGNIDIFGDTCLQVQPDVAKLNFLELCSQPCCGCDELAVIKNDFAFIKGAIDTVNSMSQNLAGELSAMSWNLVSSQTDDIDTTVTPMIDMMQTLLDNALAQTNCNLPC